MNDLISRQAAIDALGEEPMVWHDNDDYALGERNQWNIDKLAIETVSSAQSEQDWIPVKFRELTADEKEEHPDWYYMADCDMPDDEQEILVTTTHGYVEKDVCYIDDGFSLDSGYDWLTDIKAWRPLPAPWGGEKE